MKVLKSLRGNDLIAKLEADRIRRSYEEMMADEKAQNRSVLKVYMSLFKDQAFIKPLLTLILTYCIFAEFSGLPTIAFYMIKLLRDVDAPIDPYIAGACLVFFRFVALMLGNLVIANIKMRPVFFFTAGCHVVFTSVIAIYSFVNRDGWLVQAYPAMGWTPIICILLIYSTSTLGCYNVMFNFTGLLLPSYARTFGSGLVGVLDNIALVLVAKIFPSMLSAFGLHGVFAFFSGCVAVSTIILWFILPETYGLTLEDIEQFYRAEKKKEDDVD